MKNRFEILVHVILIATGIIGGTVYFLNGERTLSGVFFSIALASILYQFLGGIGEQNNFNLGAIKFGGSAAVLAGFIYFLIKIVFVPGPEEYALKFSASNWIPIDAVSGNSIPLIVEGYLQKSTIDSTGVLLSKRKWQNFILEEDTSNLFSLKTDGQNSEVIGQVKLQNLKSTSLFNKIEINNQEKEIKVFKLYPDSAELRSTKDLSDLQLPFEIKVFQGSRFSILPLDPGKAPFVDNEQIVKRTSYVIPFTTGYAYIVFLEQARSHIKPNTNHERFSKWLVKKIDLRLDKN
jgi:hypothetical protein